VNAPDSFGDELAVVLEVFWDSDNSDVAYNVIGFVYSP
jgi:hypothetical protein